MEYGGKCLILFFDFCILWCVSDDYISFVMSKEIYGYNFCDVVDFVFEIFGMGDFYVVDIQNNVIVIGDYIFMIYRIVVEFYQFVCDIRVCYWDYFNRQREVVQNIDCFSVIDNIYKFFGNCCDDFFMCQCCIVIFDYVVFWVDFISIIDIDVQF